MDIHVPDENSRDGCKREGSTRRSRVSSSGLRQAWTATALGAGHDPNPWPTVWDVRLVGLLPPPQEASGPDGARELSSGRCRNSTGGRGFETVPTERRGRRHAARRLPLARASPLSTAAWLRLASSTQSIVPSWVMGPKGDRAPPSSTSPATRLSPPRSRRRRRTGKRLLRRLAGSDRERSPKRLLHRSLRCISLHGHESRLHTDARIARHHRATRSGRSRGDAPPPPPGVRSQADDS